MTVRVYPLDMTPKLAPMRPLMRHMGWNSDEVMQHTMDCVRSTGEQLSFRDVSMIAALQAERGWGILKAMRRIMEGPSVLPLLGFASKPVILPSGYVQGADSAQFKQAQEVLSLLHKMGPDASHVIQQTMEKLENRVVFASSADERITLEARALAQLRRHLWMQLGLSSRGYLPLASVRSSIAISGQGGGGIACRLHALCVRALPQLIVGCGMATIAGGPIVGAKLLVVDSAVARTCGHIIITILPPISFSGVMSACPEHLSFSVLLYLGSLLIGITMTESGGPYIRIVRSMKAVNCVMGTFAIAHGASLWFQRNQRLLLQRSIESMLRTGSEQDGLNQMRSLSASAQLRQAIACTLDVAVSSSFDLRANSLCLRMLPYWAALLSIGIVGCGAFSAAELMGNGDDMASTACALSTGFIMPCVAMHVVRRIRPDTVYSLPVVYLAGGALGLYKRCVTGGEVLAVVVPSTVWMSQNAYFTAMVCADTDRKSLENKIIALLASEHRKRD